MTPLERAAMALLALDYPEAVGSEAENMYWDRRGREYLAQARAVLTAIREPSAAMKLAARQAPMDMVHRDSRAAQAEAEAAAKWTAMIDAAMAEGG